MDQDACRLVGKECNGCCTKKALHILLPEATTLDYQHRLQVILVWKVSIDLISSTHYIVKYMYDCYHVALVCIVLFTIYIVAKV